MLNQTRTKSLLSKLEKWMKNRYRRTPKDDLYSQVSTQIKSFYSSEKYSSTSGEYIIENRDFEMLSSAQITLLDKKEGIEKLKLDIKKLIQGIVHLPSNLVFSLLDQSYSPLGTYDFWKYKEKWSEETFEFKPEVRINKSGRLVGADGKPLFGFHSEERKIFKNIIFTKLNKRELERAKKRLCRWNSVSEKEAKFLLLVSPELWMKAVKLEKRFPKERVDNVLVSVYLEKLNWAVMLYSSSKPIIFQIRTKPKFWVRKIKKNVIVGSNMRCNAGIGSWKIIIGSFKPEIEKEIF